ncbi:ribonuclease HII [Candidatus Saccharibacteria bacterium]|nr:ribonuclease HII [Candidatus Saccharibacteria bacterium]
MAILGIDEVGRGPWAGPLVVGACVLDGAGIEGLTDSKKLSAAKREALAQQICEQCEYGLGWVQAEELDEIGLAAALRKACQMAVKQIKVSFHEIVIDGTVNFLRETPLAPYVQTMKKADLLVPEVSAAAIVAKVARDNYMKKLAEKYPYYGFEKHVGYGTATHRAAIEKYGLCPEHRRSFRPMAEMLARQNTSSAPLRSGDVAEEKVAEFLRAQGHAIVARNWRTKFCEIDIVSQNAGVFYFTEVKYRRNTRQNDGLDAITQRKLDKMRLGAKSFAQENGIAEAKLQLAVAAVSGDNYQITELLCLE